MAFSKFAKERIKGRNFNIPDGYDFGRNECSHQDHSRGRNYQNPQNGKYVNRPHHWIEHRLAELGEIDNGLSEKENQWARRAIWKRMTDDEKDYIYRLLLME